MKKKSFMAQIQNDPRNPRNRRRVIQGMITGRIKKELEICLLDQIYVKAEDGKQSVRNTGC